MELELFLARGAKEDLLEVIRSIADMVNVHFIRQKEPLGLGHAILQARQHVGDEPFAVLLGDEIFAGPRPCLGELIDQYEATGGGSVVAVRPVPREEVRRYGVIDPEEGEEGPLYRVRRLVEKPEPEEAPSHLAVVGRYIIHPDIFGILADLPPGKNGEIQLTDALDILCRRRPVYAYEVQSRRYDVGNKLGYIQATVEFALERPDLGPALREYLRALVDRVPS